MKPDILRHIGELGGHFQEGYAPSLASALQALTFTCVLYPRPTDTPWSTADTSEPIPGLGEWVTAHSPLLAHDRAAFDQQLITHFYQLTEAPRGQTFFVGRLFTPLRPGTPDYAEWGTDFADPEIVDLSPVRDVVADPTPDFVQVAASYSYPDSFYVCVSDPTPDNPTVFSTDHETFFQEVTNEGSLEAFFQRYLTPAELLVLVRQQLMADDPPTQ